MTRRNECTYNRSESDIYATTTWHKIDVGGILKYDIFRVFLVVYSCIECWLILQTQFFDSFLHQFWYNSTDLLDKFPGSILYEDCLFSVWTEEVPPIMPETIKQFPYEVPSVWACRRASTEERRKVWERAPNSVSRRRPRRPPGSLDAAPGTGAQNFVVLVNCYS